VIRAGLDRRIERRKYASAPTHVVVLAVAHDGLQTRRIGSSINRDGDSNQLAGDST
jgi:hypothetical protein